MILRKFLKCSLAKFSRRPIRVFEFGRWGKVEDITSIKIKEVPKFAFRIMPRPYLLLLSSSRVHGFGFLEYAQEDIKKFLTSKQVTTVLFIPYADTNYDAYVEKVTPAFEKIGFQIESIHKSNPLEAVNRAQAIFVGGGNTFLLLHTLYEKNLIKAIQNRVMELGVPYIGSSAGTNVAAATIHNTNDMPIVYPPSFCALNLVPFNINPHYIDPEPYSKHQGETREQRITQYHELPEKFPVYNVLALREGCTLFVSGDSVVLKGISDARLFIRGKAPQEIKLDSDLSHLLTYKTEVKQAAQC